MMNNPAPTRQASDGAVKSATRVLEILELLAGANGGLTFTEIGRALGLPKSSNNALLNTLVRRGFVSYEETSRTFSLGSRVWEIGRAFRLHDELVRQALPLMERVVNQIDEIVQLAVREGKHNVYLAKVDCRQPIQLISRVGARLLCHATGLGKVLLSDLSDEQLEALYGAEPLASFTPNTITTLDELKSALAEVRRAGFAEDREEYVEGLRCVAVPVRGSTGRVVAAMSVSIPATRTSRARLEEARALLSQAAMELSERLGYRSPTPRETEDAPSTWPASAVPELSAGGFVPATRPRSRRAASLVAYSV